MSSEETRIDRACDRFEADWKAGRAHRIEDSLAQATTELGRRKLLEELIRLEVSLRRKAGTPPDEAEYRPRFPDHADVIAAAFRPRGERAAEPEDPLLSGRFRLHDIYKRGGIGVVHLGEDVELHRRVAIKVDQDRHADDEDARERLEREGELTAGLEHPGIVPVYGAGRSTDGRPYYVMRFVQGDNLMDAIRARHAAGAGQGVDRLALLELLRKFLDVCNAIDYAHARGVLHRDLKPGNILVGRHGETLVIDWGLAKAGGETVRAQSSVSGDPAAEPALQLRTEGSSAETMPGSTVGTPSYMSPEQAEGQVDSLGPSTDVYSLGATLYAILTGRSPFPDGDRHEILARVRRGEFARPRALVRAIDPAIEAVCLKAMATRPEGRYQTPRALAEDVERWLADEPISAWREPIARRVGRVLRRHKTAATSIASAAAVALILAGIAWASSIARTRRAEADAATALSVAERLATEAKAVSGDASWIGSLPIWDRALDAVNEAKTTLTRAGLGNSRLMTRADRAGGEDAALRRDQATLKALDEARLLGTTVRGGALELKAEADGFAAAFRARGIELDAAGADPEASAFQEVAQKIRDVDASIRKPLAFALWELAILETDKARRAARWKLAKAAIPDPTLAPLLEALERSDADALKRATAQFKPADDTLALVLGRGLILLHQEDAAVALLEKARADHPGRFWINHDLGVAWFLSAQPRRLEQARCYLTCAQGLRPRAPAALFNLGIILAAMGSHDEAISTLEQALDAQAEATGLPRRAFPEALVAIGATLMAKGEFPAAIAAYNTARHANIESVAAWTGLGWARLANGELDKAVKTFQKAVTVSPEIDVEITFEKPPDETAAAAQQAQAAEKQDQLEETFRQSLHADAYAGLSKALAAQGHQLEAITPAWRAFALYTEAIRQSPHYAPGHPNHIFEAARIAQVAAILGAKLTQGL